RKAGGAVTLTVGGRDPAGDLDPGHGQVATAEPEGGSTVQLSGRTDTDLIVFFEVPAESRDAMTGETVRVRIGGADRLSLHGELI
ncbi:MAG: hypothetical protein K8E66_06005, partial [Phycisphaerales bacterium]|nr:hypothetical protein [Phycisphaerales bacterium]